MKPLTFFIDELSATRNRKCVNLILSLGWEGYGLLWALVEALFDTDTCEIEFNLPRLARQFRCEEETLRAVIEDFELFEIADGKFWSPAAKEKFDDFQVRAARRKEMSRRAGKASVAARRARKKEKEASEAEDLIACRPLVGGIQSTIRNNVSGITPTCTETESKKASARSLAGYPAQVAPNMNGATSTCMEHENETPPQTREAPAERTGCELDDDESLIVVESPPAYSKMDNESILIIEAWNGVFKGTAQAYRGAFLDPISHMRAKETFQAGYTLDDLKRAFLTAKNEPFAWLLQSALKPTNIQLLLTKGEKGKETNASNRYGGFEAEHSDFETSWGAIDWSQYDRRE